jgi:hypothetical protein
MAEYGKPLDDTAVFEVGGDAGGPEGMAAGRRRQPYGLGLR